MAESKRLALRLHPDAHEALERLSAASGEPMSRFVAALVKDAIPSFHALADAIEGARSGKSGDAKRALAGFMLKKTDDLMEATDELLKKKDKK